MKVDLRDIEVVAPNFKRRLSGVTSTIVQLIPLQRRNGLKIATLGPGLPETIARISWGELHNLWRRPSTRPFRIWHARRNTEMLAGIILKYLLRAPVRLVFTSAAQRDHTSYTKWLIRQMDAVVATSNRSGSYLEVPHTVNMHGIDIELFHPPNVSNDEFSSSDLPGRYAVGCFGRIRHQKGTDLFVKAMVDLLPKYPDWTAVITGRITPEHQSFAEGLRNKIAEAGLSDRIIFLGEVDDIKPWYRRLSLYVAPSRNEGFGLTPLEAMASQTAVVASDAGAYAEMIVPGNTGEVVAAGEDLTAAIEPYLANPSMTDEHGRNALAHVREHFALQREADGLAAIYEGLWERR